MPSLRTFTSTAALAACLVLASAAPGQAPAPGGSEPVAGPWLREGERLLDREDPVGAWQAFRRAIPGVPGQIGLGKTHLMLGRSDFALAYGEAALRATRDDQEAMALCVRALIRGRSFDEALQRATRFVERVDQPVAELLAARGSALFRVQHIDEAAEVYRQVVARDPQHAEAHLRLGSGLLPPIRLAPEPRLAAAVARAHAGDREAAIATLLAVLAAFPDHPVAHRLLGETLFAARAADSMASADPTFAALAAAMPHRDLRAVPTARFVVGYAELAAERRAVVDRTATLFGSRFDRLIGLGCRHDLLGELERTTDATQRSNLRGTRTFDGRVWDDVRGIGGMQAATGIESLDEAAQFGFDTLVHEIAHQVHFFAFSRVEQARLRSLYQAAVSNRTFLDYYAASNEAEYFGQGVEAFASLGKRPGGETTHGHTRFELLAVDPALHAFIASVVDYDPLADPAAREPLLVAAIGVALRCGRPADALVAAGLLPDGPTRQRWLSEAQCAAAAATSH